MVLAIPTASGKTLVAELCMLKTILEKGLKAIYLTPLRALASEKYDEFLMFEELGVKVGITTGDYDSADEKLGVYDLLVCTNERADSLLRHQASWLSQIGVVVADEVHLINDISRGPTLEVVLVRLRQVAPKAQILALSATVGNADELAAWFRGETVTSDWRPVKLREGVYHEGRVRFADSDEERYSPVSSFPIGDITRQVLRDQGQLLIFLNTRKSAMNTAQRLSPLISRFLSKYERSELDTIAKRIQQTGEVTQVTDKLARLVSTGVAFHHAGLRHAERKLVEDAFRQTLIKAVCCTPTLCLSPETKIWHGVRETEVRDFDISTPLFALSKDTLIQMNAVDVCRLTNTSPLIEITSVSGYSIRVTPNHRVLVKRDGKSIVIPASKIVKTDRIATVGKLSLEYSRSLRVGDFVLDNRTESAQEIITPKIAYFIGMMIGDGHSGAETEGESVQYKGSPSIVSTHEEVFESVEPVCFQLGVSYRRSIDSYGTPVLILGKNNWFREFLVRCGVEKGDRKHICDALLEMDEACIVQLLRGLFDSDGYVIKDRAIGFGNTSEKLVRQIQRLLLRFGIVSRTRKRKATTQTIYGRKYGKKPFFELIVAQNQSLLNFTRYLGFNLPRKQRDLNSLMFRVNSNVLFVSCQICNYRIYRSLFSGRTLHQKEWGKIKRSVIRLLGEKGELGSREITRILGEAPRKNEIRLNHHYELITKRRVGHRSGTEWFWSLNPIGRWIFTNFLVDGNNFEKFFGLERCPLCQAQLERVLRGTWRSKDVDGDIFWDAIRDLKPVSLCPIVYDVVLPNSPENNHMFVANGFIVHNSAGINMPARLVVINEYRRFDRTEGYQPIPVLEYKQMAGRAGRPKYDKTGTSILIARRQEEVAFLTDNYILGDAEDIVSKLASESALRSHILSTIALGYASSKEDIMGFIRKTFFGHQRDPEEVTYMVDLIVRFLQDEALLTRKGNLLLATSFGRRVSQLYIDPKSAVIIRDGLLTASRDATEVTHFSYLHLICHTPDQFSMYLRRGEEESTHDYVSEHIEEFLVPVPNPRYNRTNYEFFLAEVKTALLANGWIEEISEEKLTSQFNIGSGDLRRLVDTQVWLLYACREIARVFKYKSLLADLEQLELRVRYGVRRELAELVELKGIGRVRGRLLFRNGFVNKDRIRDAPLSKLAAVPTIGSEIARSIKVQCGGVIAPAEEQSLKESSSSTTRQTRLSLE